MNVIPCSMILSFIAVSTIEIELLLKCPYRYVLIPYDGADHLSDRSYVSLLSLIGNKC
jgi:hypothetical protein